MEEIFTMMNAELTEELRKRSIGTLAVRATQLFALSMSPGDAERFLNILVPRSRQPGDDLALRIAGRPEDLGVTDEPWAFELAPVFGEEGFSFHAIVTIPVADLPEVLARLRAAS
jgi:hypothetical protein